MLSVLKQDQEHIRWELIINSRYQSFVYLCLASIDFGLSELFIVFYQNLKQFYSHQYFLEIQGYHDEILLHLF